MGYVKRDWNIEKISADNMNHIQTQYAKAVEDAVGVRADADSEMRLEVVSSFPAHAVGRMIVHTGLKMAFYSNGANWLVNPQYAYLGNQSGGDFSSTGNINFSVSTGATVVKNYRNFMLNSNHTLTVNNSIRCLIIRTLGDLVINGTIDLDRRGGYGERYLTMGGVQYDLLGGLGGDGGNGGQNSLGGKTDSGLRGAGGLRGGGGSGGGAGNYEGGAGGDKNTPFSESHGGGASVFMAHGVGGEVPGNPGFNGAGGSGGAVKTGSDGEATSGKGATSVSRGAGGGGGMVTGRYLEDQWTYVWASPGTSLTQHGGGVLMLVAGGNLVVNGMIFARGGNGGDGGDAYDGIWSWDSAGGGGGGGSGGGRVILASRGSRTFNGNNILLGGGGGGAGGLGGGDFPTPGQDGSAGGGGSYTEIALDI